MGISRARSQFIDSLRILCKAGSGGHGLPQFGGVGGKGGDIYVKGSDLNDLKQVQAKNRDQRYVAKNGSNAHKNQLVGEPGPDLIIDCPIGVTIEDDDKQILGDIDQINDRVLVALGGRGGDKYNNSIGAAGQRRMVRLDFKMIADIGLVGFPNAGKSTLLKTLTRANPRVASFPFTTLRPNIGTMEYKDLRSISLTDLPGLVEGAHKNLGCGHRFLKHTTRTKLIAFVVDINGFDIGLSYPQRTAIETVELLQKELELYDESVFLKPAVLLLNKMDLPESDVKLSRFLEYYNELPSKRNIRSVLPISCHNGYNIDKLRTLLRETLDDNAEIEKFKKDGIKNYEQLTGKEFNKFSVTH